MDGAGGGGAADGFAFEDVGEAFEDFGFVLGEGGIDTAAAGDDGEALAGSERSPGFLAVLAEGLEVGGGPVAGGRHGATLRRGGRMGK